MKKDFLKLLDFSGDELYAILDVADKLKFDLKRGIKNKPLKGKSLGMIFEKSSTRTRVSFEVGMYQLGGQALFLSPRDLQIGRGEPLEDTARVLSRFLNGIMIRTFKQSDVEKLAEYASIPIINGLTDFAHPCQVMADLQTIREFKGELKGRKLCYIGDGNNMANSLIVGGLKTGMSVSIGCPDAYRPDKAIMEFAEPYGDKFCVTSDIFKAAKDADAIYTDVWASMGMESEAAERMEDFKGYCVDQALCDVAAKDVMVLHCLPAHRGEEITADVFEAHAKEIFEEAENRLHAQKAIMLMCMGK